MAREISKQRDRERAAAQRRHNSALEEAKAKIERARKYVKDAGLDAVMPRLWEDVRHWPSWSKMPDRWSG